MRQLKLGFFLCTLIFSSAHAGVYGDDLGKCLVESTNKEDRAALVRWMFAAASLNPAVASIVKVTPQALEEANVVTANLFMKLLTESCREKAKKALSYEGAPALQLSFQVLGQVAGAELFSSPEVAKGMAGMERSIDTKKLEELQKSN